MRLETTLEGKAGLGRVVSRTFHFVALCYNVTRSLQAVFACLFPLCAAADGRTAAAPLATPRFHSTMPVVSIDDCAKQSRETLVDLRTTRAIAHFHAAPFATNQTCLAKNLEVL